MFNIDNLVKLGAHFGYTRTRRHPSAKAYVATSQSGIDFINLKKSEENYNEAVTFLKSITDANKQILFVGTKPEIRQIVKEVALSLNMPYIADRYVGGTLTNYPQIKKRIEKLADLLSKKEKGELSVYTKKEQSLIAKDIERIDFSFGGLASLRGLPAALVVVDSRKEEMVVTEANLMGIPVVAIANTDCNLKEVAYPIVSNDSSATVVREILESIKKSLA
jgi:small subunit ribosomal protein S2